MAEDEVAETPEVVPVPEFGSEKVPEGPTRRERRPMAFTPPVVEMTGMPGVEDLGGAPINYHVHNGQMVTIHGTHYKVGENGYQWHLEYPDGQGETTRTGRPDMFTTEDVTFMAALVGTYVLTLPVADGKVRIEVTVTEEE